MYISGDVFRTHSNIYNESIWRKWWSLHELLNDSTSIRTMYLMMSVINNTRSSRWNIKLRLVMTCQFRRFLNIYWCMLLIRTTSNIVLQHFIDLGLEVKTGKGLLGGWLKASFQMLVVRKSIYPKFQVNFLHRLMMVLHQNCVVKFFKWNFLWSWNKKGLWMQLR